MKRSLAFILTILGVSLLAIVSGIYAGQNVVGTLLGTIVGAVLGYIIQDQAQSRQRDEAFSNEIINKVVGPLYAEINAMTDALRATNRDATDTSLNLPLLQQVRSNWLYYRIDNGLRHNLDDFYTNTKDLERERASLNPVANQILNETASKVFGVSDTQNVMVATAFRTYPEQISLSRNLTLDLLTGHNPLRTSIELVPYSVDLLNTNNQWTRFKLPDKSDLFQAFWDSCLEQSGSLHVFRARLTNLYLKGLKLQEQLKTEIDRLHRV